MLLPFFCGFPAPSPPANRLTVGWGTGRGDSKTEAFPSLSICEGNVTSSHMGTLPSNASIAFHSGESAFHANDSRIVSSIWI